MKKARLAIIKEPPELEVLLMFNFVFTTDKLPMKLITEYQTKK